MHQQAEGASPPGADTTWHALDKDSALEALEATRTGLSEVEARRRREIHGPNRLRPPARQSGLKRFLLQFHNVLIYVLIAAAVGTAFLQHWVDTGVIVGVVLINALIGYLQEGKAEKALDAIRDMLSPKAMVLREGRRQTVDAQELVPGDVVVLQAGDRVPADLRLLQAHNLRIDEAVLTGESVAVEKGTAPVSRDAELGDRSSLAFSGTLVSYGHGLGLVTATGDRTEIGRVSTLLSQVATTTTPLLRQMAQFSRWLSVGIVVIAALTFVFGLVVRGYGGMDMFLAAVSLAVAAIPEGLPAIMTITLALGVQRMARRNAIIRRLPAVETLGAVTVICSDKTGTLTRNEMTVQEVITGDRHYQLSGVGYAPEGCFALEDREVDPLKEPGSLPELLRAAVLCNEAQVHHRDGQWRLEGDPTEGALITAGLKAGVDLEELHGRMPRTDVIPFESSYKFMGTLHHDHGGHGFIFMKGAPERILAACSHQRGVQGDVPLDRDWWERKMEEVAARGQRLLAVAARTVPAHHEALAFDDMEGEMVLLGMMALIDPAREEAIRAVADCHRAGIQVRMITGDHALTARAIGEQLGIVQAAGEVLTGREIEELDEDQLRERAQHVRVFARTTPEHKLRLVRALQAREHVVAMTGDGVNDAPALKRADVGVAMGIKGTEAAKEASEMVLADDNFASIAHAVEEGRTVYDNLKKAILFILPTNGGQGLTIVAAILLGLSLPLEPVQVLWVNMVTAVTLALALAFEPPEPGLMARRPRDPGTPLLTGFLIWRVLFVSALLLIGAFGHYYWMLQMQGAAQEVARTVAINTFVVGQIFYLFNSRYILESVLNLRGILGSRPVLMAIGVLVVLQLLFTYTGPFQFLFNTAAIGLGEWARILVFGLVLFLVVEAEKAVLRRRWQDRGGLA
ncbi:cation-transporting P-type ATPase [Ectothiorhodospira mobilis]|uniref:cation-transporting P-type ATPase n=1 Tax=Ectothiorhodospira mobilis TaxID=195064 RepID=UPI001903C74B|nr:cation-transporting P-type ATPase [Ectothiorhodospira mobilis]MBK1692855.1 carbonate dehydratase [Ectothiorhodospira mobilis]